MIMCVRLSLIVTAAIVILAFAPAAHAQLDEQTPSPDPCFDSGTSWEACGGDGTAGGNYTSCLAVGAWGQMCQAVDFKDYYFTKECVSVKRSASCECNEQTFELKGKCTYQAR